MHVQESVIIDRPPAKVWPYIAEVEHELHWRGEAVEELEQLDPGEVRSGTRFRGQTRILGMRDTYETRVTTYEPPHRYAWEGIAASGAVVADGSYELEEVGEGRTRMTLTMDYRATSLWGKLQLPMVSFVAGRLIGRFLGRLAQLVHERTAVPLHR